MKLRITKVEPYVLHIPFSCERQRRHMQRANTHGERCCIWRLETDAGIVGYGDNHAGPEPIPDLVGRNVFELLYDDNVGDGIQLALLDAAGKALDVPVHRLLGEKVRDASPLSWWAIDMPPVDWVEEARLALALGYTSIKLKARPWFDIIAQVAAVCDAVPSWFKLDLDFNQYLVTAANAIPVLSQLDKFDNIGFYESPIMQYDAAGGRHLHDHIKKPIALHWGEPALQQVMAENTCDGFVIGGRVNGVRATAAVAAQFNKPFWLQTVGTGVRAAYAVHLGAVLVGAKWPGVTCHGLFEDDLLVRPIKVVNGYVQVPETPGLGIEVDEDALARYRVDPLAKTPKEEFMAKRRLLRVAWPAAPGQSQGATWAFPNPTAMGVAFIRGLPGFAQGITLEVVEDDGSSAFGSLYARMLSGDAQG